MTKIRRDNSSERGAVAVEFALILPILVLLVFGIVEFGRAYNAQISITHAAREGVRVWALDGTEAEATDATVSAAPSLASVSVTFTACDPGQPTRATATTPFDLNIPLFGADSFTLTGIGEMRCGG